MNANREAKGEEEMSAEQYRRLLEAVFQRKARVTSWQVGEEITDADKDTIEAVLITLSANFERIVRWRMKDRTFKEIGTELNNDRANATGVCAETARRKWINAIRCLRERNETLIPIAERMGLL